MFAALMPSAGPASLVTTLMIQLVVMFSGISIPGPNLPSWLIFAYYLSPARWTMEGLVTTQFDAYTAVACIPTGTPLTWVNGSAPQFCSGVAPDQQPASAYLTDVQVNARCCAPTTGCPMSARSYVLTGATCPNGEVVPAFLGGNNGYQSSWLACAWRSARLCSARPDRTDAPPADDFIFVIVCEFALRALLVVVATDED